MYIVLLSFILGIILSGIWFGFTYVIKQISKKSRYTTLSRFSGVLSSLIPTITILFLNEHYFLNVQSMGDWYWWGASIFVSLIAAVTVFQNTVEDLPRGTELIWYGIDGVLMEIPQRLMMQSFVWYILRKYGIKDALYLSIPVTSSIWCVSIVIQNMIFKIKFNIQTAREIIASAFFSIGVGYILAETMCIMFPMMAHFSERIISTLLRVWKKKK